MHYTFQKDFVKSLWLETMLCFNQCGFQSTDEDFLWSISKDEWGKDILKISSENNNDFEIMLQTRETHIEAHQNRDVDLIPKKTKSWPNW